MRTRVDSIFPAAAYEKATGSRSPRDVSMCMPPCGCEVHVCDGLPVDALAYRASWITPGFQGGHERPLVHPSGEALAQRVYHLTAEDEALMSHAGGVG